MRVISAGRASLAVVRLSPRRAVRDGVPTPGWCWLPAAGGQAAPWLGAGRVADGRQEIETAGRTASSGRGEGRTPMPVLLIAGADLPEKACAEVADKIGEAGQATARQ